MSSDKEIPIGSSKAQGHMDLKPLLRRLDTVMRRMSRRNKLIAVCCVAAAVIVLFLVFSGLDIYVKFAKSGRLAFSSISLLIVLALTGAFIIRDLLDRLTAKAAALHVEDSFPQLERTVSTAVEFGTDSEKTRSLSSEAIVDLLIADAGRRSRATNFVRAVDRIGPKRAGAAFGIVALLCLAYFLGYPGVSSLTLQRFLRPWANLPAPTLTRIEVTPGSLEVRKLTTVDISADVSGRIPSHVYIHYALIPEGKSEDDDSLEWKREELRKQDEHRYAFAFARMLDSIKYYVSGGDCRTEEFLLSIYEVPRITRLKMQLVYPEYTGVKPKQIDDAVGPITALRGTQVEITGSVNKPIVEACAQFMKEERPSVRASRVEGNEFSVTFPVLENDKYRLVVIDERSRSNEEAIFYTIKAVEDRPPAVKITAPGKNIAAVKTTEIPLTIEVSDDFGVTEVGIAYKVKTDDEKRFVNQKPTERTPVVKVDDTFYLELLKLSDTDVVSYYAYALDNDEISGPKENVSDLYFIEIEPFGQQYQYADAAGLPMEGKEKGKEEGLAATVEKMIQRQQKVIKRTFNIDRTPIEKRDDAHATEVKNLASEENDIRKQAESLAEELSQKLGAAGLTEQMDRADNLSKAAAQLGLASFVLETLDTEKALPYENEALYHLYRAKRDVINLISLAQNAKDPELRKKLRQALELAFKRQQSLEEQEREKQLKELRQKKREMADLMEEQKQMNEQLREETAQAAKSGQASSAQQQKMDELAEEQKAMKEKAEEQANALRQMDFDNPRQSYEAARRSSEAAMEMGETEKNLREKKIADARDHGTKAEKNLERAIREVQRALERTVKDQLRAAAEDAQQIARAQKQLRNETEQAGREEQQMQQGAAAPQPQGKAEPQAGEPKTAAQAGAPKQPDQKGTPAQQGKQEAPDKKTQTAAQPAQEGKADQQAAAAAKRDDAREQQQAAAQAQANELKRKKKELAEQQDQLAQDVDDLGKRVKELAPKVEEVEPEIGRDVDAVAEKIRKGEVQDKMRQAAKDLKQEELAQATKPQKDAEKRAETVAQELRDLAEQFEMDDARRLGRAIARARELTKKQDETNEGMNEAAAQAPEAPKAQELQEKQREVKEGTEDLAKQTDRISSLEKSGLRRGIQQSLASAKQQMEQVEAELQRNRPREGLEAGREAAQELRQTTKAMERLLDEAVTERLAKAVEKAQQAEQAQKQALDGVKRETKEKKPGQDIPPDKKNRIERDQAEAGEHLQELTKQLSNIAAQAEAGAEKQVAESVRNTGKELEEERTAERIASAQRELSRKQWRSAQRNQEDAAESLASARERLEKTYEDQTALPLQKMKNAVEETNELAKKVDGMRQKVEEAEPVTRRGGAARKQRLKELAEEQKELQEETDQLMERLSRIDPNVEKEQMEEVKLRMKEAGDKISLGHTEEVSMGLSKAYEALQTIGEGLIERLQRLVDKSKRREPEEEDIPEEYKPLAEQYSRALSER